VADTSSTERGQVVPLLLVVLALATAAAVIVAQIAGAALERSRAQTAADAAALAGAAAGDDAARAAATANDAEVTRYRDDGESVEVDVAHRRARARATAEAAGVPAPVGGGDREGLAPVMLAALARADALLGRPVPVASGHRSRAEQEALWAGRASNPFPVARPGTSLHELGLAVDVPSALVDDLLVVAGDAGLCRPLPESDPIHFEPCPPTSPA
jgi:hypothetical protein